MKRPIAIGVAVLGGLLGLRMLLRPASGRGVSRIRERIQRRMERIMAKLPENSPPKLVMSVLPQLRDQNNQIIQMLREQNELLRQRRPTERTDLHPTEFP